ncbi:MAG: general secretion pathway protein GspK [Candidatus Omnitrophica bacterium]|nr:general secretion pathway protein GspK [Candidatus Omnitrophota bacterium]MBU4589774.1 general secretion pathway protein GspK [Candidatus Omnitrophota bacterium]
MKKTGSILIFTLWVLIILTILSIIISRRASTDVRLAKYETDSIKATYLAKAGVMKMLVELKNNENLYENLDKEKKFTLRGDTVFYSASDEMAKLNLNNCTLKNLEDLGVEATLAEKILKYKVKHYNAFEFMEELFLVDESMTNETYAKIKDFVSIYRGTDEEVNINTASEEVLRAVIEDDKEDLVPIILEHRENGVIFKDKTEINNLSGLGDLNLDLFVVKSDYFRICVKASLSEDKDILKTIEAVVDKSGKIYHWREY